MSFKNKIIVLVYFAVSILVIGFMYIDDYGHNWGEKYKDLLFQKTILFFTVLGFLLAIYIVISNRNNKAN